jgi:hypothetical protein
MTAASGALPEGLTTISGGDATGPGGAEHAATNANARTYAYREFMWIDPFVSVAVIVMNAR